MATSAKKNLTEQSIWMFLLLVTVLSYATYFHRYWQPADLFWDENYHIASAQKYLHDTYFMEQHPPLGKLLIAAGEWLLHPNEKSDQFVDTMYGREIPQGFSFAGYRLASALLAWLTAPLLFVILLMLIRDPLVAFFGTFPYVFDNAIIVHSRGAMLEGPLMFFTALTIVLFLLVLKHKNSLRAFSLLSLALGIGFCLALTTKLVGLIVILVLAPIAWELRRDMKKLSLCIGLFLLGAAFTWITVWQIHFSLTGTVNPALENFSASPAYQAILREHKNTSLWSFPVMMRDQLTYIKNYSAGVPRLDLCKSDENGSPFFYWPIGARSINYRWNTPNGQQYQYLYLQSNPVGWFLGFGGVLLAIAFLAGRLFLSPAKPLKHTTMILTFLMLYGGYMAAISMIERVMYLYHYFVPLFFSFILFVLVFDEINALWGRALTVPQKHIALATISGLTFLSFLFYSPLTYYRLIDDKAFMRRAIIPL
jgi:dolichyl-phosphate-mannose--protein O-mannosyl transferase